MWGHALYMAFRLGYGRRDSVRFSYLVWILEIDEAGIFELRGALRQLGPDEVPALVVGTVTAAVNGYAAIAWLIKWLGSHDLIGFAVYRVVAGLGLLAALAANLL